MNKLEQPLYPKLSSIYNKIMQLMGAILLIVFLMVLLVANTNKNEHVVQQHFEQVADKLLDQAIAGISVIFTENKLKVSKKKRYVQLQSFLNKFANADYIKAVHLYDKSGLLLSKNDNDSSASASIKLLYGIDESINTSNISEQLVPVIKEIRNPELTGYLRLTIEKSYLTSELEKNNRDSHTLSRLFLVAGGLIGFLLTRGLNRFSRQGYRPTKVTKN